MANKTKDYYPKEKGVIRRDRAGEFRDFMAKELMMESLGLIPVAGMAGKFGKTISPFLGKGKAMRPVVEYTSEVRPLRSLRASEEYMRKEGRTTKKLAAESLRKKSDEFKKDLLSGKVDALGKPQTEVGRSRLAKYGPKYTDAGIESRMGTPGVAASSYGGVANLKDWTPVAVSRFKDEIKKNDKIYDKFVKGFKEILKLRHNVNPKSLMENIRGLGMFKEGKKVTDPLERAKFTLTNDVIPTRDLNNKAVQEYFLKPAAKQARSELAKQFPKVPK